MPTIDQTDELLSLAALARQLDLSYPTALRHVRDNRLIPDFTTDSAYLFYPSRVPELRRLIQL